MIELLVVALIVAAPTFLVGMSAGAKVRGMIPLRSPSNRVRIADAEADVEVTEHWLRRRKLEREIAQEEMSMESDQIQGRQKLAVIEANAHTTMLQLEAAKEKPETVPAEVVKTRRAELRMTQERLRQLTGLSSRRITELEAGNGGTDYEYREVCRELDLDYSPLVVTRPDRPPMPAYVVRQEEERKRRELERQRDIEQAKQQQRESVRASRLKGESEPPDAIPF